MKSPSILHIESEIDHSKTLLSKLIPLGAKLITAPTGKRGLELLGRNYDINTILLSLHLPDISNSELIKKIRSIRPNIPIIGTAGQNDIDAIVQSIINGANDYILKPLNHNILWEKLTGTVKSYLKEISSFHSESGPTPYRIENVIFKSRVMKLILGDVEKIANSSASVFITGESGTGKDLIAKTIHYTGTRKGNPFIALNCSAIPRHLIENELFGHERGAYTGADSTVAGKFEAADGGTIFLDEIAEIPAELQSKLLRVLQERRFTRIGGTKPVSINVRVIAATNRDIQTAIKEGKFREDLYFRLDVLPIHIQPLRERTEDIMPLAEYFLDRLSQQNEKSFTDFDKRAKAFLLRYRWPGNVRELQNVIERAVVTGTPPIIKETDFNVQKVFYNTPIIENIDLSLKEIEKKAIIETLELTSWNISRSARQLGINRDTLYRKMREHTIAKDVQNFIRKPSSN